MVLNSSLVQLVTRPTRFRAGQIPFLLDLILVSDEDLISDINFLPPFGKSDHLTLESKIQFTVSKKTNIDRRSIEYIDYESVSQCLSDVKWENELGDLDVDSMWVRLLEVVGHAVSTNTSRKEIVHNVCKPWIDFGLVKRIRQKKTLWQRFLRSGLDCDYRIHRSYSNVLDQEISKAKRQYESKIGLSSDRKKFFKYVRSSLNSKVSTPLVRDASGSMCGSLRETSEVLADVFSASFSDEPDGPIPDINSPYTGQSLCEVKFDRETVQRQLEGLSTSSAPGPDGLTAQLLRSCAASLSGTLTLIFAESFRSGTLPSSWLKASITPVFKKGDKFSPQNY
ncbi:uncharacterized protein LOC123315882 [Coccinella septempunctata]|uniref:uncharacterized protein LOC123315882 n=1 Tax=Coccinella septempunctata TaxID=41139 RepID=UPI001D076773|nr:uncharacterized protein LOC123315882 [Coccinella septempunctata]